MIKKILVCVSLFLFVQNISYAQGTWKALTNPAPLTMGGGMVLLTDGTVMCKGYVSGSGFPLTPDATWMLLTPDIHGSYLNGTWTVLPSEHDTRSVFSSQVLPNGNVYVAGGEHGNGTASGEIYNTVTHTWNYIPNVPGYDIEDANSELLYDGTVLEGCANPFNPPIDTINMFYSPVTGNFSAAPSSHGSHEESSWLKLPDSSVLYVDAPAASSERYIPKLHKWVVDGTVPVALYDFSSYETGPCLLLPNGKGFFMGDVQYSAIYTPSGNTSPGVWSAGPQMPTKAGYGQLGSWDGPGAMMVNGKALYSISQLPSESLPSFFYEFNYNTNTFNEVGAPGGGDSVETQTNMMTMLDLPDGTVLFAYTDSTKFYEYLPGGAPIPQGKPTINGIFPDSCNKYMITGKLFNGISEGASFGDDWQMSSNYPIIRVTNGSNVYYCKTTNWNRLGAVMTDSAEDTAYFTVPSMPGGTYSLVVVANGNPSNPVPFTTFGVSIASQTNISNCSGLGGATAFASNGNTPYTYLWSNGATTASDTNLTGGTYTITVTESGGCSVSANVTITQPGVISLTMSETNVSCNGGNSGKASVTASGGSTPYTYNWSNGATTSNITGLTAGSYSVTVTDAYNGCGDTAMATITQPAPIAVTFTNVVEPSSPSYSNGSITGSATGGTPGYSYSWTPSGATSATLTGLTAGTYTLCVTDAKGCTKCDNITLVNSTASVENVNSGSGGVIIFPNPAQNSITLLINDVAASDARIEITDLTGRTISSIPIAIGSSADKKITLNISGLTAGIYFVRVSSGQAVYNAKFIKE
ncbi:MAG: T9SS type A sorting domain-containing protein [Bacteroidia bacterium]|nr:T9SS type A sorting domain-containing protein [Bacteroidia bacterium]